MMSAPLPRKTCELRESFIRAAEHQQARADSFFPRTFKLRQHYRLRECICPLGSGPPAERRRQRSRAAAAADDGTQKVVQVSRVKCREIVRKIVQDGHDITLSDAGDPACLLGPRL